MNELAKDLEGLDSAEAFMEYFGLAYDARILNVSRLHILKRFNQYIARAGGIDNFEPVFAYECCRGLLKDAYQDFVASSGVEQKVFRVFRRARGEQHVPVTSIVRAAK